MFFAFLPIIPRYPYWPFKGSISSYSRIGHPQLWPTSASFASGSTLMSGNSMRPSRGCGSPCSFPLDKCYIHTHIRQSLGVTRHVLCASAPAPSCCPPLGSENPGLTCHPKSWINPGFRKSWITPEINLFVTNRLQTKDLGARLPGNCTKFYCASFWYHQISGKTF